MPTMTYTPMSENQHGLWLLQTMHPELIAYNVSSAFQVRSHLDVEALHSAFKKVVCRYPILRTTFTLKDENPTQCIHPEIVPDFAHVDVIDICEDALKAQVQAMHDRPFNLETGPLTRLTVFSREADSHVVLFDWHHILLDFGSQITVTREILDVYQSIAHTQIPSPNLLDGFFEKEKRHHVASNYANFVTWQENYVNSGKSKRSQQYWTEQLQTPLPILDLPTDHPYPTQQTYNGNSLPICLSEALSQDIITLAKQAEVTPFVLLLSAYALLMARYSNQDDLIIGVPTDERLTVSKRFQQMIGHMINLLPMRLRISKDGSFEDILHQTESVVMSGLFHQNYSFARMVQDPQVKRESSRPPLFDVSFNILSTNTNEPIARLIRWVPETPMCPMSIDDLQILPYPIRHQEGQVPLHLDMWQQGNQWVGYFKYNTDLFDEATIARMASHFTVLLEGIVKQPKQPVHQLSMLTEAEYHQIVHEWNDTAVDFGEPKTIHTLFEQQVERTPDAVAVVFEEEQLTYSELNLRANQLAHHLIELGVEADTLVAVAMERSIEMVVSLLAVLKAGGAYVPIDPTYPEERIRYMLMDSAVPILLTQSHLSLAQMIEDVDEQNSVGQSMHMLAVDRMATELVAQSIHNPQTKTSVDDLAYVIYTSGSTGQPKGVMLEHGGAFNVALAQTNVLPDLTTGSRLLQLASLSFDAATAEIMMALMHGVTLVVAPANHERLGNALAKLLQHQRITHVTLVPSVLQTLPAVDLPDLKVLITAGEACSTALVNQWGTVRHFFNFYGPTESPIWTTYALLKPNHPIHIGQPIPNRHVYILNDMGKITPIGLAGELHIGGTQLARGYLNRSELTAERFINHPEFGRLYKTGDLCRWLLDGNIEYIGRTDFQVKIRGFRIELGEVENALLAQEGVREAVVLAREENEDKRLVAYIVESGPEGTQWKVDCEDAPSSAIQLFNSSTLRNSLAQQLPDYMIPSAFVFLDAMPLMPNGKLDRRALPAPDYVDAQTEFVAPRTEVEQKLAAIWQEVLGIDRVGIYDNFFAMGGHSLLATQVIAKIRQVFALELRLSTLFASPTIEAHAEALLTQQQEQREGEADGILIEALPEIVHALVQRHEPFPLTDIQYAYWVGRGAEFELGNISAHVYFELNSETLDVAQLNQAWQRLVERHEMLRCIIQSDGQQRILASVSGYEFALVDLQNVDETEATQTLDSIREEMSHQVLPADQWPLFDIRVTRLSQTSHRLHISLDGLILDGTSVGTLLREWVALYQHPQTVLTPLNVSFRDYIFAERIFEESNTYQKAWDYWQNRLDALPPAPELPLAQDVQTIQQPQFNIYQFQLDASQWTQLKKQGNQAGLTDSAIILSAFAEILTAWSKQPHFTLNLTLFNRLPFHPQINDILGDFTPLLMLAVDNRQQASEWDSFVTRAQRIQEQLWQDLDHRVVNGVRVLRELTKRQERGANRALMPVVFTSMLATPLDNTLFDPIGTMTYVNSQTPQVWLDHGVIESAGALDITWSVVEELFPDGLVAEMFDAYCALLERLATREEAWHTPDLPLLLPKQQAQRQAVNNTTAPISEEMLHTLFVRQVEIHAREIAIITPTMTMIYAELYHRANQIGHWLRRQGAKPNTLVGVVIEKGWEQVVAVLGIHLAGAAYLPIDPNLPIERQHYLLSQGEATIVLTQSHLDTSLTWPQEITRLQVDTLTPNATLPRLETVQTPTDLAYVIYTSGSTGQPKGVVIDHRGAVNTVLDVNQRYGITANDRVLALSALNFDLSVYDIFGLLAVGGSIVFPDPERRVDPEHWHDLIQQHGVTIWNTVPALMQMLVEYEEGRDEGMTRWQDDKMNGNHPFIPSSLHLVMLSGDWIPVTLPDRIRALHPSARIYSMGGATEASIWSIYYPIEEVDPTWPSIPYGKPMTNQTFHVLDANLNPRPTWVPGDLYIGGIGLALGYWKDEERTDFSFITHPRTGKRLYKTGDLGRYLPAPKGEIPNIEFLGREDFQVKIRGHRIELGEIESALLQHDSISEAVVNAVGDPRGHRQLVGYVVLDERNAAFQPDAGKDVYATNNTLPDVYGAHLSVTLTDPIDRLEFKLRQPGIRDVDSPDTIALPTQAFDETRRRQWLSRQSHRQFLDEMIDVHDFSEFLSCLMQMPLEERPLPKYRYPSAGNLYPVQCYLYIKPERIAGLAGGYYYYRPTDHQLIPLQADAPSMQFAAMNANQAIFDQSAFTLFLVADLEAIAPMYGAIARDFSLLEAGYISQLLMMEAPQHALGLCPIGGVDPVAIQTALALGIQHEMVHSLAGGRIDPQQALSIDESPVNTKTTQQPDGVSWQRRLQDYLTKKLPAYMVPTTFVALPSLPLTANGKLDRRVLPAPDYVNTTQSHVSAKTFDETRLVMVWQEVLGVQPIGVADNFFELGGDSLLVTQLVQRMRQTLQREISLRQVFSTPTIRGLLRSIDDGQTDITSFVPLRVTSSSCINDRQPLFLIYPANGVVFPYANLLPYLEPSQPVYALLARGIYDDFPPFESITSLATTTISEMKIIQPHGPYAVGGWSSGGTTAFEIARQLIQQNDEVSFIGLMDSHLISKESENDCFEKNNLDKEIFRKSMVEDLYLFIGLFVDILITSRDFNKLEPDLFSIAIDQTEPIDWLLRQIHLRGFQLLMNPAIFKRIWDTRLRNRQLTQNHRFKNYTGNITFFCTGENEPEKRIREWQKLTTGAVDAVWVDGNHMTMLNTENVERLGRALAVRLEAVDQSLDDGK